MIAGRFIDPPRVDCREVLRRPAYTSKPILTTKGPGDGKSSFVSFGAAIEKYKAREGVEGLGEREHLQVDHKPIWYWPRCQHNDVITRVQWRPRFGNWEPSVYQSLHWRINLILVRKHYKTGVMKKKNSLHLVARPAKNRRVNEQSSTNANQAYFLSNFWFTAIILVPSSGLIVFQGVGLLLVQMTGRNHFRRSEQRNKGDW